MAEVNLSTLHRVARNANRQAPIKETQPKAQGATIAGDDRLGPKKLLSLGDRYALEHVQKAEYYADHGAYDASRDEERKALDAAESIKMVRHLQRRWRHSDEELYTKAGEKVLALAEEYYLNDTEGLDPSELSIAFRQRAYEAHNEGFGEISVRAIERAIDTAQTLESLPPLRDALEDWVRNSIPADQFESLAEKIDNRADAIARGKVWYNPLTWI